ncbi:MAG: TonB-dependent receptor [Cyclobacteriaceae bacterium]|nr:TonB-dependent receptor [Cyclobacteriaceae bacterium]
MGIWSDDNNKKLNIQLKADYEILDDLIFDVAYSFQSNSELRNNYESKESFGGGLNRNGLATKESKDFYNQLLESTLRWNGNISNGTIDVVGGYSYQEFYEEGFRAQGGDFITDAFAYNRLKASNDFKTGIGDVTSFKNTNKLIAFFGRVNMSWDQTWFLSVSGRREGSSKFGTDKKWGFFPGASGGVELANFINSSSINNLKFRVSYGEAGNNLKDSYLSLVVAEPGDDSFYYNGDYVPAYGPLRNSNPNLGWESKKEINIGLDYSFFNDKVYGAIDYYSRKTESLLWLFGVPQPPNLASQTWANVGDLRNSGLEFLVNLKAVDNGSFSYIPTLTATWYIENKIVSLSDPDNGFVFGAGRNLGGMGSPGQNDTPLVHIEEGAPLGQLWGWKYVGISPTGELQLEDISGPEGKPDGGVDADDRTVIGNGLPSFEIGFGNSVRWNNWDANVFFRGVFGHDLINSMRAFYEVPAAIRSYNVVSTARDMKNPDTGAYLNSPDGKLSDLYVENADFFKLENLSIGYNLKVPSGSAINNVRFYFAANNLFVITGYKGTDPEVRYGDSEDDNNPLVPGVDRRDTWYMTRSFSLGVSLGFN